MKKVLAAWLVSLLAASAGAVGVPEYPMTTDVASALSPITIMQVESSSMNLRWYFEWTPGSPYDLTGASEVFLEYGPPDRLWTQIVTGSVINATGGVVRIPFTPLNTATNGLLSYNLRIADGGINICRAYGDLLLLARAGAASTPFPTTTNVVDLTGYTFINYPWPTDSPTSTTDTVAREAIVSHTNENRATVHKGFIQTAYDWATNAYTYAGQSYSVATNALAIALTVFGWGNHAEAGYVTGTVVRAESDPIAGPIATNALSIAQALTITVASLPTSNNVFEVWREMAATSSVVNAENAMNLVSPEGWVGLRMSNGVLWVTEVTNTTSLSVVHVSGDGYNGPVLGTAFVGPPILLDGGPYWKWANDDFNFISDSDEDHPGEIPTKLFGTSVDTALDPDGMWIVNPGTFTLNAFSGIAVGSFTVDWLKSTNTYSIGNGVTNINGKSGAVIVLTAADVGAVSNALWNGTSVAQTNGTLYLRDDDSAYLTNVPSTVAVARINFSASAYTNKLSILNDGTSWMFEGIGKSFYYSGYNHTWKSSHSGQELVWGYNGLACNSANMTLGYSGAPWVLTASGIIMNNYRVSAITNVLSSSTNALVTSGAISNYLSGGTVHIKLPTATNGLASGELWNNSGTLSVMP